MLGWPASRTPRASTSSCSPRAHSAVAARRASCAAPERRSHATARTSAQACGPVSSTPGIRPSVIPSAGDPGRQEHSYGNCIMRDVPARSRVFTPAYAAVARRPQPRVSELASQGKRDQDMRRFAVSLTSLVLFAGALVSASPAAQAQTAFQGARSASGALADEPNAGGLLPGLCGLIPDPGLPALPLPALPTIPLIPDLPPLPDVPCNPF